MLGRLRELGAGLPADVGEALRLYRLAVERASAEAYAMAPFLALHWLRLRLALAPLLRVLGPVAGALQAWLPADGTRAGSPAAAGGSAIGSQAFQRRAPALPAIWDTLLIAALVGALSWVLWRKRQLQQRGPELDGMQPTAQLRAAQPAAAAAAAAQPASAQPEASAPATPERQFRSAAAAAAAAAAERRNSPVQQQPLAGLSTASDATVAVGMRQRAAMQKPTQQADDASDGMEPGSRL